MNLYNSDVVIRSVRGNCSMSNPSSLTLTESKGDTYTINTNGSYTSIEGNKKTEITGGNVVIASETLWIFTRTNQSNRYAEFIFDSASIYGNCEISLYTDGEEVNLRRGFCDISSPNIITLTTFDRNSYSLDNSSEQYIHTTGDTKTSQTGQVEVFGRQWQFYKITSGFGTNKKIVEIRLDY